jgi:hypothetical protein
MSQDAVLEALKAAGKPLNNAGLVAATGLDKVEIVAAIKALKTAGLVVSPKNCFYAPAEK